MKKIWGMILSILGVLMFFLGTNLTPVQASDQFLIEKYHANADIQKNGDINLTQKINYQFDGDFHGVFYNQDIKGIKGVSDPEVFVNDGYNTTKLTESQSGQENTYKVSRTANNMGIKVYHAASTENLTFIYKYKLYGAVTNYSDTAEMNWKMIGDGWDDVLHKVVLTVNLPQKNVPELQAWTHGPLNGHTEVDRKNGQVVMKISELPKHDTVESHVIFPTAVTPDNTNIVNKKAKSRIQAQEKQLVLDANASRTRQDWIYRILMTIGFLVILVIYLYRFRESKRNPANKHVIPTPLYHSFDEPKFLPSMAKVILDHSDKADSLSLTADLLNEVGQRRMKIEKVGRTYEITALKEPTNTFFKYLIEEIGDGKKVSLKQIKSSAKGYGTKDKLVDKFDDWAKQAATGREKYLDKHNMDIVDGFRMSAISTTIIAFIIFIITLMFERNILLIGITSVVVVVVAWIFYFLATKKATVYTDLGEEEVNQIRAFKRMLTDIDDIKMAEVGDLILWEQFLPYAVVFGVSDKVIKALKVNFNTDQINQSMIVPFYIGSNSFLGSSTSGFQSAFAGAISAGGSSSISGGSGGFSGGSSGGFGGGSGGGAF